MEKGEIRIKIAGDFVINKEGFSTKNIHKDVISFFEDSDLNIINLECPVTTAEKKHQILKTGPHLKGMESSIEEVLKLLNINLLTLANNHILDYGEQGLQDTINFLKQNNFDYVGAGEDLQQAKKVFRKKISGKIISIINIAENEWSSASLNLGGANPMDIIDNIQQIQQEKLNSDFVFVIIHGGHEYYNLPSPRMVKQYRFYAENGADMIIGHHTHCVSGFEMYKNVPICYSLGNFLFTENSIYPDWYKGLILEVIISSSGKISVKLHPIEYLNENFSLKLLDGDSKMDILDKVKQYSEIISNPSILLQEWELFVEKQSKQYLGMLSPISYINNRYVVALLYKLRLSEKFINKIGVALSLNLHRCEAHSDLAKEVMTKYIKK